MMEKPIFVVGSGRSGTTILDRSLGQHSSLTSFPFEPQVFSKADLSVGVYQLLGRTAENVTIKKIETYLFKRYSFKPKRQEQTRGFCQWQSRLNYERLVEQYLRSSGKKPENTLDYTRDFINRLYEPYVTSQKASNWVDGSPVNGRLIRQITLVYPEAFFVHVVRDGRDVAKSFTRLGWAQGSFEVAVQFWACQVRIIRQLGKRYAPGKYIEIKFEDLVKSPREVMIRLSDFLEIEYNPKMISLINPKRASRYVSSHSSDESEYVFTLAPDLVEDFKWKL